MARDIMQLQVQHVAVVRKQFGIFFSFVVDLFSNSDKNLNRGRWKHTYWHEACTARLRHADQDRLDGRRRHSTFGFGIFSLSLLSEIDLFSKFDNP